MAREVHDREDLLRDAKALTLRVQLEVRIAGKSEPVFAGFRSKGALSLYFGAQPVYHFNSLHQLRRAHVDDCLIKAESGRLIALQPQRSEKSVEMLRHEMIDSEQHQFCSSLQERLHALKQAFLEEQTTVVGQVSDDADVVGQLQDWLENQREVIIADSPGVG